jgi:hypothetical protein
VKFILQGFERAQPLIDNSMTDSWAFWMHAKPSTAKGIILSKFSSVNLSLQLREMPLANSFSIKILSDKDLYIQYHSDHQNAYNKLLQLDLPEAKLDRHH